MNRSSFRIDSNCHWHIFNREFINRFHTQISKAHHLRCFDSFRYQISGTTNCHQISRFMLFDRFNSYRTAFRFTDHGDETCLCQHHLCELIHACGGGWTCGPHHFITNWIDWTDVIDHTIFKINRKLFTFSQHISNALVSSIATGQHFAVQ